MASNAPNLNLAWKRSPPPYRHRFLELGRIFLKLPKITSNRKSIARTLSYRTSDKTLEAAEVDAAQTAILTALEKTLPAKVRG